MLTLVPPATGTATGFYFGGQYESSQDYEWECSLDENGEGATISVFTESGDCVTQVTTPAAEVGELLGEITLVIACTNRTFTTTGMQLTGEWTFTDDGNRNTVRLRTPVLEEIHAWLSAALSSQPYDGDTWEY